MIDNQMYLASQGFENSETCPQPNQPLFPCPSINFASNVQSAQSHLQPTTCSENPTTSLKTPSARCLSSNRVSPYRQPFTDITYSRGQQDEDVSQENKENTSPKTPTRTAIKVEQGLNVGSVLSSSNACDLRLLSSDTPRAFCKPPYSYSCLIVLALKNSQHGYLPVLDIYSFIRRHFPHFEVVSDVWKNSVRHNLSLSKGFDKVGRYNPEAPSSKKGCLWALNPDRLPKMDEEITRARVKEFQTVLSSMRFPERLSIIESGCHGFGGMAMDIKMKFGSAEFGHVLRSHMKLSLMREPYVELNQPHWESIPEPTFFMRQQSVADNNQMRNRMPQFQYSQQQQQPTRAITPPPHSHNYNMASSSLSTPPPPSYIKHKIMNNSEAPSQEYMYVSDKSGCQGLTTSVDAAFMNPDVVLTPRHRHDPALSSTFHHSIKSSPVGCSPNNHPVYSSPTLVTPDMLYRSPVTPRALGGASQTNQGSPFYPTSSSDYSNYLLAEGQFENLPPLYYQSLPHQM